METTSQQPAPSRLLFWKCPARCGGPISWDRKPEKSVAHCSCGESSDGRALTEGERIERDMQMLDAVAHQWAKKKSLRMLLNTIMHDSSGRDERLMALLLQAHAEGLYAGRMSHKVQPASAATHT